ncbi:MAG TPA: phenylacetic acid degradation b, partial [Cytophagales bacterium]|nr:phenylacetic acid degradation b [Cytophagales bacterium]
RLGITADGDASQKAELDQHETFEVFLVPKENRPYEHAGIVHAPNIDMAFLFGKEQYSRRFTCEAMAVAATRSVKTTEINDNKQSIYTTIGEAAPAAESADRYEVFHLYRRGAHVLHQGSVPAADYQDALRQAKLVFGDDKKPVLSIWLVKSTDMQFVDDEDRDLWNTLSEKGYRDSLAYKAGDKLTNFKKELAEKSA